MSITDTPYRSPGVFAAEIATIDHLSGGGSTSASAPAGCPRSSPRPAPPHIFPSGTPTSVRRSRSAGHLDERACSSITASSPTSTAAGSAHKPLQKPAPADLLQRPPRPEAFGEADRQVRPVGLDRHPGHARGARASGGGDPARSSTSSASHDRSTSFELCSMCWFAITDEPTDQTRQRQAHQPPRRHPGAGHGEPRSSSSRSV